MRRRGGTRRAPAVVAATLLMTIACSCGEGATETPLSAVAATAAATQAITEGLAPGQHLTLLATLQVATGSLSNVAQRDVISLAPFLNDVQLVAAASPTSDGRLTLSATLQPACPSATAVSLALPTPAALATLVEPGASGTRGAGGTRVTTTVNATVLTSWLRAALPATLRSALRINAGKLTLTLDSAGRFTGLMATLHGGLSVAALLRGSLSGGVPLAGSVASFPGGTASITVSLSAAPGPAQLRCSRT